MAVEANAAEREHFQYPDDRLDAMRYRALVDASYQVTVEPSDPSVNVAGWVDVSFDYITTAQNVKTLEELADALIAYHTQGPSDV